MELTPEMLDRQVRSYRSVLPTFRAIAGLLEANLAPLARSVAPGCEVMARAKTIASFAGKIQRKKKYLNPLVDMTDLCGARIVCLFESEVQAVCELIRARLGKAIDENNSLDQRALLRAGEFGYRSVHYVIQLRPEERWKGLTKPMKGKKVEIQVRTRLQHIWSEIGHDRVYKAPHALPESILREVARLAARFESIDEEFERLASLLEDYRAHFGTYLDEAMLADEKQLQAILRKHDRHNAAVPLRQAELAFSLDDWPGAIDHIRRFQAQGGELTPGLEAALGFALCQQEPRNRSRPGFIEGHRHLQNATRRNPRMVMAWVRRGECTDDQDEATICYHNAYRIDPLDPAALAGYIRWQLDAKTAANFVELLRPTLGDAISRCERQAAVRLDLPWAWFRAAFFRLLLLVSPKPEQGRESSDITVLAEDTTTQKELLSSVLKNYASAVALCRKATPIRVALDAVKTLQRAVGHSEEVKIARLFLQLAAEAWEARSGGASLASRVAPLTSAAPPPYGAGERVMILAGTSRPSLIDNPEVFARIIGDALKGFRGTVISGGTRQGVPGIVGKTGARTKRRIRTIGYIPALMPASKSSEPNERYSLLRQTAGVHFSPLEPLQAWVDLLAAGVKPEDVTVLGLGGGRIAAFEYRLALLLGARVGIIVGTGRAADEIAADAAWQGPPWKLWRIPLEAADAAALRAFVHPALPLPPLDYDALGRLIHGRYVADNRDALLDPKLRNWDDLPSDYRDSSRDQMKSAAGLLAAEGFGIRRRPAAGKAKPFAFSPDEHERLARLEHGRWMIERVGRGWIRGKEKNPAKKTHPDLVRWEELSSEAQQKDFKAVANWPSLFAAAGYAVVRSPRARHPGP